MGDSSEARSVPKRELRNRMRRVRRELADRPERSDRIVGHLIAIDAVSSAERLMVYDAVPGEVDLARLAGWTASKGIATAIPEDDVEADWPDVIIVPGTAFTERGERLGQGGGWYDRFLPGRRPDAVTIGVCFASQLLDDIPVEDHDVRLDCVVTENGPARRAS